MCTYLQETVPELGLPKLQGSRGVPTIVTIKREPGMRRDILSCLLRVYSGQEINTQALTDLLQSRGRNRPHVNQSPR